MCDFSAHILGLAFTLTVNVQECIRMKMCFFYNSVDQETGKCGGPNFELSEINWEDYH